MKGRRRLSVPIALLLTYVGTPVSAQGVRGWVGSTVQWVELRPVAMDTVAVKDVTRVPGGRYEFQGRPVSCISGLTCIGYRALNEETTLAATQDVAFTAWGFGVQGLSFTALLRARARMGSDLPWPRSDDQFDAMLAYGQLERGRLRVRAGRQEIRSGLGFPAFDGASATLTVRDVRLEAYGGRSLARGLRDPAKDVLRGLEDFVRDQGVYLIGGSARLHVFASALTARYHREIYADRAGLASERASLDVATGLPGARISGSIDYDVGFNRVGKGHLTLGTPLADGQILLEATARRYLPYFEMSTIWGFFQPVSYSEEEVRLAWSPARSLGAWVSGGVRSYGDAGTTIVLQPLADHGRRAGAGVRWQADTAWSVDGSYRLEWGPGGFLSSGDAAVRWTPRERISVSATATSFQQIEQYRLGDGRAWGGGISADIGLTDRVRASGGISMLHLWQKGGAVDSPWNQTRGWTALRIEMGRDPGLANRRSP